MSEDTIEGIGDEAYADKAYAKVMQRCDAEIEREFGPCTREEYLAFLEAKVERARADFAAGRVLSNEQVERQAEQRREELLARIAARK